MSMLADRKRKQKWSLNPRGNDWAQDSNKFGQKMLEKMGWTSGKGLGAKENGITEHVKVSYKNDSKGMGYKETDEQWTAHETNFSALLENLCGQRVEEVVLSSLEEKSQKSRARVHYKKFTRGKDLSRYSEKDLANIFGKKSLKELKKSPKEVEELQVPEKIEEKSVSLLNGGLMSDYFKKKVSNFGSINGYVVGNNGVLRKAESESEMEVQPSYGQQTFVSYIDDSNKSISKNRKEKKRKLNSDINDLTDELKDSSKKKKKKNKLNNSEGMNNPAFDPLYSAPIMLEKHSLDPIEETLDDTLPQEPEHLEVNVQIHDEEGRVRRKEADNSQRKRKTQDFFDHLIEAEENKLSMNSGIQKLDSLHLGVLEKEAKNSEKKKKNKDRGIENPVCQVIGEFDISVEEKEQMFGSYMDKSNKHLVNKKEGDTSQGKMKTTDFFDCRIEMDKKKKKKNKDEGIENPVFQVVSEKEVELQQSDDNPFEVKVEEKKKKKKKHKSGINSDCGLDNPVFIKEFNVDEDLVKQEYEVKRKKSKKEKGLDNPALNLSDNIEDTCDLMLNIVSTPVTLKQTDSSLVSFNTQKTASVTRTKSVRFSDITRERIIPTKEQIKLMEDDSVELDENQSFDLEGRLNDSTDKSQAFRVKKRKKITQGLANEGFDQQANNLEENLTSISNTLDQYQAEIENDMNEEKMKSIEFSDIMIGEVGNPHGQNEKLCDGTVRLKFKDAKFGKNARYMDTMLGPKKPYKHLIKGDIILNFRETNLHEIEGYAAKKDP